MLLIKEPNVSLENYDQWQSVASSDNGMTLGAAMDGGVYLASPTLWTGTSLPPFDWKSLDISSSGSKIVAVPRGSYIWISQDAGATWIQRSGAGLEKWISVALSADGNKVFAAADNGFLYTSVDGGVSWTTITSWGRSKWTSVACSGNGQTLVAATCNGLLHENPVWIVKGCLVISKDGGHSWTMTRAPPGDYTSVACSADGTFVVAVSQDGGVPITSNDGGMTWVQRTSAGSGKWMSVALSADGSTIVGVIRGGNIRISVDFGNVWENAGGVGNVKNWNSVATSADGTKILVGVKEKL
jgi:hypothetical protein